MSLTSSARTLGIEGGRAPVACHVERGCRERERNFVGREKGTGNQRRGRRPLELEREGKWKLEEEANLQRQGSSGDRAASGEAWS